MEIFPSNHKLGGRVFTPKEKVKNMASHIPQFPAVQRLTGHSDCIWSMSFSPDCEYLATGGRDSRINVYQRHKKGTSYKFKKKCVLTNHSNSIYSVSFSSDGKYLASGSADNKAKIYGVGSFEEVTTLLSNCDCRFVSFSSDGKYLVSNGEDYTVKIRKVDNFEEVTTLPEDSLYLSSASFSPDGKHLAITGSLKRDERELETKNGRVKIYQVDGFDEIASIEIRAYPSLPVSFSPDSRYLAVGNGDTVKIYQVDGFDEITSIGGGFQLFYSVAFSPDGRYLASGAIQAIKIHKVPSFEEVVTLMNGKNKACWSVAFSPDGRYLASGHMSRTIIRSIQ